MNWRFAAVTGANRYLKTDEAPEINPLVRYYFDRNPPDPITSVSYDGRFLAYTDWESCDLAVKLIKKSGPDPNKPQFLLSHLIMPQQETELSLE